MEQAICFDCQGDALTGVLSLPERDISDVGVVVVVGGPQYRAGSHRQFVLLARRLAANGYPTLRFDARGMGDSTGCHNGFESIDDDIDAAITALISAQAHIRRIILWGLCDGASAALIYCRPGLDRRIGGLCLANPWVRSPKTHARTQVKHYYRSRLQEPAFWLKLLSGQLASGAISGLWTTLRQARLSVSAAPSTNFQDKMLQGLVRTEVPKLFLFSGEDFTAREFGEYVRLNPSWHAAVTAANVTRFEVPGADHTFSSRQHSQLVEAETLRWIGECIVKKKDSYNFNTSQQQLLGTGE